MCRVKAVRKKGPVCEEDNYVSFRDRNVGWISGEQIQKASEFRDSDVPNSSKAKMFQKSYEPHSLRG